MVPAARISDTITGQLPLSAKREKPRWIRENFTPCHSAQSAPLVEQALAHEQRADMVTAICRWFL